MLPVIIIIVLVLSGCTAFVVMDMPMMMKAYFGNSSEKLVDELYIQGDTHIDIDGYRFAVEGVLADNEIKKVVLSVTATSLFTKKNFSEETCPNPYIIEGIYNNSPMSTVKEGEYRINFYFEIESINIEECFAVLSDEELVPFSWYSEEEYEELNQYAFELMDEGYTQNEAYKNSIEKLLEEKFGKFLRISLKEKESKNLVINLTSNNFYNELKMEQIVFSRTNLHITGTGASRDSSLLYVDSGTMPTIYFIFKDGTEMLFISGNMGYERNEEGYRTYDDNIYDGNSSAQVTDTGKFDIMRTYFEPVDLDLVEKVIINNIEYDVE